MDTVINESKRGLTDEKLSQLQRFIKKVKKGEITPFKTKTERAKKNLKKSGLIK